MNTKFCHACGGAVFPQARFCSSCGVALDGSSATPAATSTSRSSSMITTPRVLLVIALALPVWGIAWFTQDYFNLTPPPPPAGSPGGMQSAGHSASTATYNDPQLVRLRDATKASPNEIAAHQALAGEILERLQGTEEPPSELVMELVQVLGEILRLDPKDKSALVTMADVSFNQRVFDKAADYYRRFLELEPADNQIRARLGSSLAFLTKYDEAQAELQKVLKADPNNFEASAYLAITHAQMGNSIEAIKLGEEALKKAPSDEARARFSQFIDSVKGNRQSVGPEVRKTTASSASTPEGDPAVLKVVQQVKENQISGPKFVRHELANGGATLKLFFKQFPMEAMPPFIRDRFLNKLKDAGAGGKLKDIIVLDADQGTEMARIQP